MQTGVAADWSAIVQTLVSFALCVGFIILVMRRKR